MFLFFINHVIISQLLEWTEKRGLLRLSNREYAKCIDLVRKSRGVEAAEKYFTDLPNSAKNKSTYGALLHCFCCEEMTEKAMMLFGKMKELNFPINSFDYCSLMSLHLRLGQLEKVPLLHEEIKQKGIKPHLFHYKLLINSYASLKDVKSVEGVMEEIKMIKGITPDWAFYSNVAAIYVAAGYHEKAELTLKEIEISKLNDPKAFHFLLSIYASMGKVEEVNRVWQSLKSAFPKTSNLSYLTMLQTLSRLEYMGGLKRCFDEWELHCSSYDIRLANVLIKAYLKRNMTEEANSLLSHLLEKRYELNFRTYALFTEFYLMTHSMDLALKFMGLGTPYLRKSEREMYKKKVHEFLKYFEEERDVCGAKELCNILKQVDFLDLEVYASLLCNNIPFERKERQAPQIMRGNGVEIISESETT
ncbi:hypothetical protein IFM89_018439 [Coptis chinensis]|uniref:Pentatricopeptide repeat-containing protein n=1 Tax=Coptis chinensis TaxID=261450 RepID=A0A835HYP1_9MAGN|nr:hypothetical protein IFM89_018439 [Coptis chinensis]